MAKPLRIAVIAPIARPVTPSTTSSIEKLVSLLTEELVARGHAVTLFASGDSVTSATLAAPYPRSYRDDPDLWTNWQFHELVHTGAALEQGEAFDVLHSHVYRFPAPVARLVESPILHTDHMPTERDVADVYARFPGATIVAVSRYQRRKLGTAATVEVVHNAVDVTSFPFSPVGRDYLLFLGHLIPRKGPLEAIRVARRAGLPLVMAGGDSDYFRDEVAPLVDGREVRYVGRVDAGQRNALLAGAGALLFTSVSSEPFGLVLAEAMACGTPVAALTRCAVPEIVEPGLTGYHAEDAETLAACIPDVLRLDRGRIRGEVLRRFNHPRMVDDYERLYRRLTAQRPGRAPRQEVAVR